MKIQVNLSGDQEERRRGREIVYDSARAGDFLPPPEEIGETNWLVLDLPDELIDELPPDTALVAVQRMEGELRRVTLGMLASLARIRALGGSHLSWVDNTIQEGATKGA